MRCFLVWFLDSPLLPRWCPLSLSWKWGTKTTVSKPLKSFSPCLTLNPVSWSTELKLVCSAVQILLVHVYTFQLSLLWTGKIFNWCFNTLCANSAKQWGEKNTSAPFLHFLVSHLSLHLVVVWMCGVLLDHFTGSSAVFPLTCMSQNNITVWRDIYSWDWDVISAEVWDFKSFCETQILYRMLGNTCCSV